MNKKNSRSAFILPALLMAALVLSISATVYGKSGNEVNVGEADSHLKVNSSKASQGTAAGSAAADKADGNGQGAKEVTDEALAPQLQRDEPAAAGKGAADPSSPQHMSREKVKHSVKQSVKDKQMHKAGTAKP